MNTCFKLFWGCLLLFVAWTGWSRPTDTNSLAAAAPVIRSVFIVPSSPKDGRDPFYPESQRLYKPTKSNNQVVAASALVVRGFSGDGANLLVIINNHTFGVGDESNVSIPGGRVHVRCLEINPGSVVIEVNGQKRELKF